MQQTSKEIKKTEHQENEREKIEDMIQERIMYKAKGHLTIPLANVFFPENIHKIFIQTNGIRIYVL